MGAQSLSDFPSREVRAGVHYDHCEVSLFSVFLSRLCSPNQSLFNADIRADDHNCLVLLPRDQLASYIANLCLCEHNLLLDVGFNMLEHCSFNVGQVVSLQDQVLHALLDVF